MCSAATWQSEFSVLYDEAVKGQDYIALVVLDWWWNDADMESRATGEKRCPFVSRTEKLLYCTEEVVMATMFNFLVT